MAPGVSRFIIAGSPCSGKSTQAKILAKYFDMPRISTGEYIRKQVELKTPVGLELKPYVESGKLIPAELSHKLTEIHLNESEYGSQSEWVMEGFPREPANVEFLTQYQEHKGFTIDAVVWLHVPHEELFKRKFGRESRPDDQAFHKRLERAQFEFETVRSVKARAFIVVDGLGSTSDITKRILNHLCFWCINTHPITIGVQKGRSFEECSRLLEANGLPRPLRLQDPSSRNYTLIHQDTLHSAFQRIRYVEIKPRDTVDLLMSEGHEFDMCVVTDDTVHYSEHYHNSLRPCGITIDPEWNSHLTLCARDGYDPMAKDARNKLVTEYASIDKFLQTVRFPVNQITQVSGQAENLVQAGIADLAFCVVETGNTLKATKMYEVAVWNVIRPRIFCNTGSESGVLLGPVNCIDVDGSHKMETAQLVKTLNSHYGIYGNVCFVDRNTCDDVYSDPNLPTVLLYRNSTNELDKYITVDEHNPKTYLHLCALDGMVKCSNIVRQWIEQGTPQVFDDTRVIADDVYICGDKLGRHTGFIDYCHPDDVSEEQFKAMPLVIKGESKEVRYLGKGQVLIDFIPTIYSYTQNRCGVVEGSNEVRLSVTKKFVDALKRAGIRHAYRVIGKKYVLADLVVPHAVEFRKYGLPEFTFEMTRDLTKEEWDELPRAPPIEIVAKYGHWGTSKHRYKLMNELGRVRDDHPTFGGRRIEPEKPYPKPYIRFDWRNPLTMKCMFSDVSKNINDESEAGTQKRFEKTVRMEITCILKNYMNSLECHFSIDREHKCGYEIIKKSNTYRALREAIDIFENPEEERVHDEILSEKMADWFINVKEAEQTALNTCAVMQRLLNECDVVCNDVCLFISQDGRTVYGEISPDCGRFRHYDKGELDKDVWRHGGSSDMVLSKWNELSRLVHSVDFDEIKLPIIPPPFCEPLKLCVGTTNPGKLREISSVLSHLPIELIPCKLDIDEPYNTFSENAWVKAEGYCRNSGMLTLAEDSGICIDTFKGLPGARSARFDDYGTVNVFDGTLDDYKESGRGRDEIDKANNELVLQLFKNAEELDYIHKPIDRSAHFEVSFVLMHPIKKRLIECNGYAHGTIATECRGEGGFGYDPIFIGNNTNGFTYAELDNFRKDLRSHRRQALEAIADYLATNFLK